MATDFLGALLMKELFSPLFQDYLMCVRCVAASHCIKGLNLKALGLFWPAVILSVFSWHLYRGDCYGVNNFMQLKGMRFWYFSMEAGRGSFSSSLFYG